MHYLDGSLPKSHYLLAVAGAISVTSAIFSYISAIVIVQTCAVLTADLRHIELGLAFKCLLLSITVKKSLQYSDRNKVMQTCSTTQLTVHSTSKQGEYAKINYET